MPVRLSARIPAASAWLWYDETWDADMRTRLRTWVPLTVLGLVALTGVVIMSGGQSVVDWADRRFGDRLASAVDAEVTGEIPPGADLPTVVNWFKRRGMTFNYGPDPSSPDSDRAEARFDGLPPGQVLKVVNRAVGYTGRSSLGRSYSVAIYFYFGEDGRAITHVVRAHPAAG
jgi:hypothetical protein